MDGINTAFVWDGRRTLAEYNLGGDEIQHYVYGADPTPIAVEYFGGNALAQKTTWFHTDALGSVAYLSDNTGKAKEGYTYGPFGEGRYSTTEPYRFAGMRLDNETGLYYDNARYYSPQQGRFISPDPIGAEGGVNIYAYTGNDPLNRVDLTGLDDEIWVHPAATGGGCDCLNSGPGGSYNYINDYYWGGDGGGGGGSYSSGKGKGSNPGKPAVCNASGCTITVTAPKPAYTLIPVGASVNIQGMALSFAGDVGGGNRDAKQQQKKNSCGGPTYFTSISVDVAALAGLSGGFAFYYNPSAGAVGVVAQGGVVGGAAFGASWTAGYQNGGLSNFLSANEVLSANVAFVAGGAINPDNNAPGGFFGGLSVGAPIGAVTGNIGVAPLAQVGGSGCH